MEQLHNMITGCIIPGEEQGDEDSEEEGGEEDIQWLGYKEVAQLGHGKSLVPYEKPKRIKGEIIDLQTRRTQKVAGSFHFLDQWWQTTILRTKKTRDKCTEPKDYHALCYRLRDDPGRFTDCVVQIFLTKIQDGFETMDEEDSKGTKVRKGKKGIRVKIDTWFIPARNQFEVFLRQRNLYDDLDLTNLEERLDSYIDTLPEDEQNNSSSIPVRFKNAIVLSGEFRAIQVSQEFPELLHYLPQLFPGNFKKIISLDRTKLEKLKKLLDQKPGHLAFKPIVSKKCNILGCETSYEALSKAGLLPKIQQDVRDAVQMYEYIKKETRENGHTFVHYDRIMDILSPVIQMFEEALEFLNKNNVTRTQVENGSRIVFLMQLWQAENKIARGINSLLELEDKQPWDIVVDWSSEDFDSIRRDHDQMRAAKLIACKPVVAISGKGGCGKTYVVTKVITAAKVNRTRYNSWQNAGNNNNDAGATYDDTQPDMGDNSNEDIYEKDKKDGCPEKIQLLLTAPTGKAANLLGKRAKHPSFTLHQVIYSYRNMQDGVPWKHKDVNTLVVDECSLVSVSTFSFLIELLQEHAQLRKIVLLGDVRQLPSIEPGNFLADTFSSLERIGCAVELRNNHRAESEKIVNNATKISKKMYPIFDAEQFNLKKLPPCNPTKSGDDYTSQDISEEVRKLLNHEALKNHVNSQFISFTRKVCDSVNDLCCKHYSNHRTKEFGKLVFRVGDKICCTKNGYVNKYENKHGIMTCFSDKSKSKTDDENSQGGVDRSVIHDEELDYTGNQSTIDVTAGTSTQKKNEPDEIRLCNGEIFFIVDELETNANDQHVNKTFLQLSDKDPDPEKELLFWVDKMQIRRACKIRHAWARTIHTFQGSETDNVVYIVGSRSWRQNWQHVYTAVTRGRKSVFIIGQDNILRDAIKRSEIKRQTSLRKQLLEKLQKNKDFNTTLSMQQLALNSTTILPPTQPAENQSHNAFPVPTSCKSCDDDHPIEDEMIDGNASMNNTQMVTDILSSLAQQHEDQNESLRAMTDEIEEYESDDSQSLFASSKPIKSNAKSTTVIKSNNAVASTSYQCAGASRTSSVISENKNQFNNISKDDGLEDLVNGANDEDSYPDSDNSQSLISPPNTRLRTRLKASQSTQPTNSAKLPVTNDNLNFNNVMESKNAITKKMSKVNNTFTHLKSKRNQSKLSLKKGKFPLSFSVNESLISPMERNGPQQKHRYSFGKEDSPAGLFVKKPSSSTNPDNIFQTSSPIENMPTTRKTVFTYKPLVKTGKNMRKNEETRSYENKDEHVIKGDTIKTGSLKGKDLVLDRRLSDLDDIKAPNSNESIQSQWSDMNESELLILDETQAIPKNQELGTNSANDPKRLSSAVQPRRTSFQNISHSMNISTASQWSEVDDEQYMTLDIDDITNMTSGYHGDVNYREKESTASSTNHMLSPETRSSLKALTEEKTGNDSMYRESNVHVLKTPEILVPDSPPSPSVLETPPPPDSRSPNRKRGMEAINNDNIVSPIKRSLSQLKFK